MSREDELKDRVRASGTLTERLAACRSRIGKMCSEGRPPRMTVPVQWYDDDWFISVTIEDAIALLSISKMTAQEVPVSECPRLVAVLASEST